MISHCGAIDVGVVAAAIGLVSGYSSAVTANPVLIVMRSIFPSGLFTARGDMQ